MSSIKLKRGKGEIELVQKKNLIAIKTSPDVDIQQIIGQTSSRNSFKPSELKIGDYQVLKTEDLEEEFETSFNEFKSFSEVEDSAYVYSSPDGAVPFIPTGEITLRFKKAATLDQKSSVLEQFKLVILDSYERKTSDNEVVETFIVKTTSQSPEAVKVMGELQTFNFIEIAEADLLSQGKMFTAPLLDELLHRQWHLKNVGGDLGLKAGADARVVEAWEKTGSLGSPNCIVAIIDDGFDLSHPDLSGDWKIVAPFDFTNNIDGPPYARMHPNPRMADYHGTAVAGIAVGNANGKGIMGAAPNCRLMPIRWGKDLSDREIEKWFDHAKRMGASVVNCSWGPAADYYPLSTRQYEAIEDCALNGRDGLGCVIIFAAGNDDIDVSANDYSTHNGFAAHPNVITVAACNSVDKKSHYSNYGKAISVCAPSSGAGGRMVVTSDFTGQYSKNGVIYDAGYSPGPYTRSFGGTSSAAPLVAGICGLILSLKPELKATEVKDLIERTARKIGGPGATYTNGHSIYFGYGCINASAALQELLV